MWKEDGEWEGEEPIVVYGSKLITEVTGKITAAA